jgi:hypothetical protein
MVSPTVNSSCSKTEPGALGALGDAATPDSVSR